MYLPNNFGARDRQQVVIAFKVVVPVGEAVAPLVVLPESVSLDHRAHRTIEQEDPLFERGKQALSSLLAIHNWPPSGRTPSAWQIANASSDRFSV